MWFLVRVRLSGGAERTLPVWVPRSLLEAARRHAETEHLRWWGRDGS